jgi:hypothetical protein
VTSGSKSAKVNEYFNLSCFNEQPVDGVPTPIFPVIGSDGLATGYANGGVGVTNAPGQNSWDIALIKRFPLIRESNAEFRSEFFNAFNHAQLGAPNSAMTGATFGKITSVSANPRIIQFALKINF